MIHFYHARPRPGISLREASMLVSICLIISTLLKILVPFCAEDSREKTVHQ